MLASIKTGSTSLLSVKINLSCLARSSAVKPRTIKSEWFSFSHSCLASFFSNFVHGAPSGPLIKRSLSHTSTQLFDGNLGLVANSIGNPSQSCTSSKNRRLSSSSSATGLLTTRMLCVSPYFSIVFLAATAEAAPQLNQTVIVCMIKIRCGIGTSGAQREQHHVSGTPRH